MNTHPQEKFNYNHVTDGILIGNNQCCQAHFHEELIKQGISADVSLENEKIDAPFGVDFYIWIPVPNRLAPTPEQLDFGAAALEKLVAMGKKVYVHCQNGHGRAPTLVAAYLIKTGKTSAAAEAFIKAKRPSIHLEAAQKRALQKFALSV